VQPILDLHQDLLSYADSGRRSQTGVRLLESSPVRALNTTAFPATFGSWDEFDPTDTANHLRVEQQLRRYLRLCHREGWQLVTAGNNLDSCRRPSGARGMLLALEGLDPMPTPATLDRWWELGMRTIGPVWFFSNDFGGSSREPRVGLKRKGRDFLRWAQGRPLVLDYAHLNRRTFWQVVELTDGPVVITHGAANALVRHDRNLDDDQLDAVRERNGVVGLALASSLLRADRRARVADAADHLDHIRSVAGVAAAAIGSDLGGARETVHRLASVGRLPTLLAELELRGWSRADRDALAWGNAHRVLTAILGD
jgi:membrane dipeptidase